MPRNPPKPPRRTFWTWPPKSRLTRRHSSEVVPCPGCLADGILVYPVPCCCGGEIHHEGEDPIGGGHRSIWECDTCYHKYMMWPKVTPTPDPPDLPG